MMYIRKLSFLVVIACFLFLAPACAQTLSATPNSAISTGTRRVSGDSPTRAATLIETEAPTATAEIAVPQNAPLVVYVKGGNIWLWAAADSPKQLTNSGQDSSPKISDDAQVIVFIRNYALWAIDPSGANERLLVSDAALTGLLSADLAGLVRLRQFDFAPHQHVVYFNTTIFTEASPIFSENLISINADSAELRVLLDAAQGGGQFIFSPDGTKIALARSNKINVANLDGSNLKTVFTFPLVMLYSEVGYIPEIVWLPDGSGFKTVIPAPQRQLDDLAVQTRFMFISADGKLVAKLAEFTTAPPSLNRSLISPDGSKVSYAKARGGDLELHIIDASTADQVYFSHAANAFGILGWTPDSTHVVYWRDDYRSLWLGPQVDDAIALSDVTSAENLTWVGAQRYLFVNAAELRFRTLGQPSILLDSGLNENVFDFTMLH